MQPTQRDWEAWRYGAMGKWFFGEVLEKEMRRLEMQLGQGSAMRESVEATALEYTRSMSEILGIAVACSIEPFKEVNDENREELGSDR